MNVILSIIVFFIHFWCCKGQHDFFLTMKCYTLVVAERDALAISKSPYVVHLFYSFQSKDKIFFVSILILLWVGVFLQGWFTCMTQAQAYTTCASTSTRSFFLRLCLCLRHPGSHMAYACACVVCVNQPLVP